MTARPAPDSRVDARVEKVGRHEIRDYDPVAYNMGWNQETLRFIERFESAGLLVLLSDDELVERIARELARQVATSIPDFAGDYVERYWTQFQDRARAVLAALAAPGGEGA